MFGIQQAAPSVVDFGGLVDSTQAVALRGGKLRATPVSVSRGLVPGMRRMSPSEINQTTRNAFEASLDSYLGKENAAHALRLGGADTDRSQPLMGAEIRDVLVVAHRIMKFTVEISQLKKIHIERLIARNAEDSQLVLQALDRGTSRDQMQLSGAAQARVDEARRMLDAKCAEFNGYLQSPRASACAH